jgi:preprotein translocase subunit YajC
MNTLNISLILFGVFVWVIAFIAVRHDKKVRDKHTHTHAH